MTGVANYFQNFTIQMFEVWGFRPKGPGQNAKSACTVHLKRLYVKRIFHLCRFTYKTERAYQNAPAQC